MPPTADSERAQGVVRDGVGAPGLDDDEDDVDEGPPPPPPPPAGSRVRRLGSCLRSFFTHLFSNVGLFTLVGGYVLLGALLFEALEGSYEMTQRGSMKEHRDDCLRELWALTERFNVLYQENWTQQAQEQLRRFETRVVEATKVEGYDGKDPQDQDRQWSFSGALLYSVTVITTIGYGNLAPRTPEGKVVTMLYALVGVPLMLLCLSNLGSFLADTFQFAYSHACCKPCRDSSQRKQKLLQQDHQQRPGYNGFSDGNVSLGPPGSIACPAPPGPAPGPPPGASPGPLIRPTAAPTKPCGPSCAAAGSFGYYSSAGGMPLDWGPAFQDREREQELVPLHGVVVKTANGRGQVVSSLLPKFPLHLPQHQPQHLTPEAHQMLTECVEYQMMHEDPGAAVALRGIQGHPPACPASCPASCPAGCPVASPSPSPCPAGCPPPCPAGCPVASPSPSPCPAGCPPPCPAGCPVASPSPSPCPAGCPPPCPAGCPVASPSPSPCPAGCPPPCPAQHHDMNLAALHEEPEDEDDGDHRRGCGPHSTPSRVPLLCRSSSVPGVDPGLVALSTPVKRAPPPPPRRYAVPPPLTPPPDSCDLVEVAAPAAPRVPVYLVLLGLTVYICLGAAVFAAWEEWSFLDGAYFCFVTLSTIGFGDLVPGKSLKSAESQGGQLQVSACVAYLLLGLVLIATAFSLVQEEVLTRLSQMARTLGIISKHHQPRQGHQNHHQHYHQHQQRRTTAATMAKHHQASQTAQGAQGRRRSDPT